MRFIKNISFFLIVGIILTLGANYLESTFLFQYLRDNIIGLLLTLLAINTATLGLIASKIQDISVKFPGFDFSKTIKEMKISLLEQIILISLSIVVLIIENSEKLIFDYKNTICNIILVSILIYAINILWDTGKGVFVIIDELQNFNNKRDSEK